MADPNKPITPIPGALPLRPGDLDGLWESDRHRLILDRVKYLVRDDLEEPPHIRKARETLEQRGRDWRRASEKEICEVLDRLPKQLFQSSRWRRGLEPPDDPWYYELMARIHRGECEFYGFGSNSAGGDLLRTIRDAKSNRNPKSLFRRLKRAGVKIDKIIHFTRKPAPDWNRDVRDLSLPLKLVETRKVFLGDLVRFWGEMQGSRRPIPHRTYEVPSKDDKYIEKGIMKINKNTLVFDTTLNSGMLQAIQETGFRPGVIIQQLTFWPDGADEDQGGLRAAQWLTYGTTNWLTQYFDVFSRHPGSGFVTCNPTIYIRKGDMVDALKSTVSEFLARLRPKS